MTVGSLGFHFMTFRSVIESRSRIEQSSTQNMKTSDTPTIDYDIHSMKGSGGWVGVAWGVESDKRKH